MIWSVWVDIAGCKGCLCYNQLMTERFQTLQAVFVLLRNDKNEILLQKRAGTGYLDGYWDFPSGHVEFGESLRDTASRETKEEINIDVAPEDLELIHIEQFFVERNYINYTFEARSWQREPRICEPEKCSAIGWFSTDALPRKCVNAVRAVEASGFSSELTYSVTNKTNYASLIADR